jgi:GT2 family glycosyltransferase
MQCIASIYEKTNSSINFEVIVVDNKSEHEDFAQLKKYCDTVNFKNLSLIANVENSGFGGGNMHGFKKATGNYIAFVNNDVLFKNDCLNILSTALDIHPHIGICGPTTYKENGEILPTLDFFTSPLKVLLGRKIFKYTRPKDYQNRKTKLKEITAGDFVSGSFMMIKKEHFLKAGGFDTNIFLYHEETDLCKRLKKLHLIAACIPQAECLHYHGASTPKSIKIKAELKRSLLYVIKKHYGDFTYHYLRLYFIVTYSLKTIVKTKYKYLLQQIKRPVSLQKSTKTN